MEENGSKKIPPSWWVKVIEDLERASLAARKSFKLKNVVVDITVDNNSEGAITGYLIRMETGKVGYYPMTVVKQNLPVGARIKGNLPTPESIVEEPSIASYTFEVIRENVNLVPRLWLRKTIDKIIDGKPITMKEDLKPFPEWVLLPPKKKKDKALIDLLYRAARYEGLKGLTRFNDIGS